MTREELAKFIESEVREIVELFKRKNLSYGADRDGFFNFRETAKRVWVWADGGDRGCQVIPYQAMFRVLLTYIDKHYVALCNRGLHDPEVKERLRDIIVYALIGLAMAQEVWRDGYGPHVSEASANTAKAS